VSAAVKGVDEGRAVREGEELDVAKVDAWLKGIDPSISGAPAVTQFSGGASNWTYRLAYSNRDLVLRRPPAGTKAKSARCGAREGMVEPSGLGRRVRARRAKGTSGRNGPVAARE
jgi:hypothetical protein